MPISKKLRDIKEPMDIDIQLMATEMDTSVNRSKYLSENLLTDGFEIECFERLINDIEKDVGLEVTAFNDNTILYEYLDEAVVIHTMLADKYVLFDSMLTSKVENRMMSFRDK